MSQSLLSTQCPPIMPNVSGSRVWNQTFVPRKGLAIALSTWMIFACLHMKAYVCFMKSVRVDYLSRNPPTTLCLPRLWTTHRLSKTLGIALLVYIWNHVFVHEEPTSRLSLSNPPTTSCLPRPWTIHRLSKTLDIAFLQPSASCLIVGTWKILTKPIYIYIGTRGCPRRLWCFNIIARRSLQKTTNPIEDKGHKRCPMDGCHEICIPRKGCLRGRLGFPTSIKGQAI